jgi:hypothetical protein
MWCRAQDQTKNLLVLVGYLLSLPADVVEATISGSHEWLTFWLHLLNVRCRHRLPFMANLLHWASRGVYGWSMRPL